MLLALFQGGWMAFDGGRALVVGDYVTPKSGPQAGQLGPWARVVAAVDFDPRSRFIKGLHLVMGLAWLVALWLFLARSEAGWWGILFCALRSLWYLPVGTLLSVIQIVVLLSPSLRGVR